MLASRAQRRNHIVSTAIETIAKKHRDRQGSLSTCDQQFTMNCQEHNGSWKGSASVLASISSLLCGEKKTRCHVHDGSSHQKTISVIVRNSRNKSCARLALTVSRTSINPPHPLRHTVLHVVDVCFPLFIAVDNLRKPSPTDRTRGWTFAPTDASAAQVSCTTRCSRSPSANTWPPQKPMELAPAPDRQTKRGNSASYSCCRAHTACNVQSAVSQDG